MRITTRARSRAALGCIAAALLVAAGCGSDADHAMDTSDHDAMGSTSPGSTPAGSDSPGSDAMSSDELSSETMSSDGHGDDGHQHDDGSSDGAHGANSAVPGGARRIDVAATSFAFAPDELVVSAGEPIAIALRSDDIVHDFVIDEFGAHISAAGGQSSVGGFTAGKAGTYTFYCSVEDHRASGMEGILIVQ